jgi:hypothetical protein
MAVSGHQVEIVEDGNARHSFPSFALQELADMKLVFNVQMICGLIQEQNGCFLCEGPGKGHSLPLPTT